MTEEEAIVAFLGLLAGLLGFGIAYRRRKGGAAVSMNTLQPQGDVRPAASGETVDNSELSLEPLVLGPLFDTQGALSRVQGDADLYRRLLKRLRLRFEEFSSLLQKNLADSDWPALAESSHTLKGIAATLGAWAVCEAAVVVETATKAVIQGGAKPHLIHPAVASLLGAIMLADQDLEKAGVVRQLPPEKQSPEFLEGLDVAALRKASRLGDMRQLKQLVSHLPESHALRSAIDNYDLAWLKKLLD